jgi:hypothetical protein
MPAAIGLLPILKKGEKPPHGAERQDESGDAQDILAYRHSDVRRLARKGVIGATQIIEISDQQDRGGHKDKARAREKARERCAWFGICYHDKDHHKVPKSFGPALESYIGEIGPKHAEKAIREEDQDGPARPEKNFCPMAAVCQHQDSGYQ